MSNNRTEPLLGLHEAEQMWLTKEDSAAFLAALANPPEPNQALKDAAAWYRRLTEGEKPRRP